MYILYILINMVLFYKFQDLEILGYQKIRRKGCVKANIKE